MDELLILGAKMYVNNNLHELSGYPHNILVNSNNPDFPESNLNNFVFHKD